MSLEKNSDGWDLVQFFIDCHNVDSNHIRAYDQFIAFMEERINTTITVGDTTLKLKNLQLVAPYHIVDGKKVDIFPSECIEMKESYSADVFCDIECLTSGDHQDQYEVSDVEMLGEFVEYMLPDMKIKKIRNEIFRFLEEDGEIKWKSLKKSHYKNILKFLKPHIDLEDYACNDEYCECFDDKYHHVIQRIEKRIKDVCKTRTRVANFENSETKTFEHVHIGSIPVMVGSCLCNLRTGNPSKEILKREFKFGLGGYFVKGGIKRSIVFQERSTFNRFMLMDGETSKSKNVKYLKSVEIRNSATDHAPTSSFRVGVLKDGNFYVNMKYLNEKKFIPALHLFHAMGFTDPKTILNMIIDKDDPLYEMAAPHILKMFEHAETSNYLDELGCLGKDKVNDKDLHVQTIIDKHFMHHYRNINSKARYYGFMLYTLLKFMNGDMREEDRDHFGKKVLDTESSLFSNLFYSSMKKTVAEITSNLEKCEGKTINANILFPHKDSSKMPITTGFSKALTTNNWGGTEKKDGVCQIYEPHNYAGAIIALQRCTLNLPKNNKKRKPRMVHGSMYGVVDPFYTPEGENIGFNKVIAALCYVTQKIDASNVLNLLMNNCLAVAHIDDVGDHTGRDVDIDGDIYPHIPPKNDRVKIFVDSHWIGVTEKNHAIKISKKLRIYKRACKIDPTISIVWNDIHDELHIFTQIGRLMRPWLVVKNGELLFDNSMLDKWESWDDALSSGTIEMLDQNELEFTMIATSVDSFCEMSEEERRECHYCDIHPATLFGAGAGTITDPSRNQGPRNAYGAKMTEQAIGTQGRENSPRTMFYPHRALVQNKLSNVLLKYDQVSAGENVPIAFMPYKGMTIEDGSVVCKSAIDMGLFWTSKVTSHTLEIKDPENEIIEIPVKEECIKYKSSKNHNLDENGLIKVGSLVQENDVLCGKTTLLENEKKPKSDSSMLYKDKNRAYVKSVNVIERGWKGTKIVKVDLVEIKIPEWGNKITPLCAQKTTISEIAQRADMPFCPHPTEAPNPIVIYSPLCFPSRMTISLLYETFLGNYIASADLKRVRRGKVGKYKHNGVEECTQFDGNDKEKLKWIMDRLKEMGYRSDSYVELYNGMNGKVIETHIFTGIVHMQVLKHMVSDKINVRSTGPFQPLMRCPTEGRAANGGAKIGNMEKDCIIANGATHVLLDSMCLSSNKYVTTVCSVCGIIETYNSTKNATCRSCRKDGVMVPVLIPYSFKVVAQELMSLGIMMRVLTQK